MRSALTLPEEIINEVTAIIRSCLPADYKILLFGSQAKSTALGASDIDIGILGKERVPWKVMAQILERVDRLSTLRSIDIVDLKAKGKAFRENVLKHARALN